MEALQDVREVLNPGTTVTGENIMSQAKWYNAVTRKSAELGETLSKEQVSVLERIGKDLDRGAVAECGEGGRIRTFRTCPAPTSSAQCSEARPQAPPFCNQSRVLCNGSTSFRIRLHKI
jgi:hypothetical protein